MGYDTCGDHGGTNRSGEPCGQPAGYGTDFDDGKCKHHRGTNADGSSHAGNDYGKKHGAFSDHFRSDLTDAEEDALEALVAHLKSIDDERTIAAEIAAEALMKYKRSADSRFLREARQWFDDFNLLPNEDTLEVGGTDGGALSVAVERKAYDGDE